ncbi:MAG: type II toxin-antitoxin system RelE/ParE family toxin [Bacteroidota bacterium]|nr:type II toxin-antitoxin system RelE/ParE family toxin [Bacteroidota bacterium]
MKVEFKKSFVKDLKKLKNKSLKSSIADCIVQVESASNLTHIKNLKKLAGYDIYYRIRIGDYRIGIKTESNVVYFVVYEHRRDIYKGFP